METIRRDLERKIVRKKIANVEVRAKKIVKTNAKEFVGVLRGNQFLKIERRGKLLIFNLKTGGPSDNEAGKFLLTHLKMTGQLIYRCGRKTIVGGHDWPKNIGPLPNKFTHLIFSFADKSKLFYNDMRKFGYMKIANTEEKERILTDNFGMDAMDVKFTLAFFKKITERKKESMVKTTLLDQRVIAGIGNIYADEILHEARVMPNRKIGALRPEEIKKIFQSIKKILKQAIRQRGTTFGAQLKGHYVDSQGRHGNYLDFLKVYQREGKRCVGCPKGTVEKKNMAGRGTRFCSACQR